MKNKLQFTSKTGARLTAAFIAAALAGSTLAACSNSETPAPAENAAPTATEEHSHEGHDEASHDKTVAPKIYSDISGKIVSINPPDPNAPDATSRKMTITLDHEEIPDFMRAMEMKIALKNPEDAKRLKAGDKISCDFVVEDGKLTLDNIRVLPADTKLKLAPA